ncbi:hypothetical protein FJV41_39195 [Myxococcus llanfairpwllgwyngyllgogerychwyrndrobwllllantysiliogogogochensis]|uniref:Uncharacterized protein n=1 Tax=Myxococcus llanfairpwllgwyngyllgogerychwyrndrobwllllantysiliogogogochensis TaxID=2590453 RepID=A0A540WNA0_9BACT|nr:hypothetical protein [Myxococcus llanfairpwllgwyngyllgogerychwyrndrobwllllantysiliogogogochensis]TQF10491.1 hypothetical protein FJV41_39195 [Myxococcus llanfairpwllgwyngyllgogerychwyrndrobwllllantysiliogogogochensis]
MSATTFASICAPGPLGHVVTLRGTDVEVEAHAPTRQEAESDASLALTRERRRLEAELRRGVHRTLSTRHPVSRTEVPHVA